jgi:hypothetical protein
MTRERRITVKILSLGHQILGYAASHHRVLLAVGPMRTQLHGLGYHSLGLSSQINAKWKEPH